MPLITKEKLKAAFREIDPEGLIALGSPIDEYDNEAEKLFPLVFTLFSYEKILEEVAKVIHESFCILNSAFDQNEKIVELEKLEEVKKRTKVKLLAQVIYNINKQELKNDTRYGK